MRRKDANGVWGSCRYTIYIYASCAVLKKKNGMKCHVDIWSIPTCVGILCSSWVVGKWPIEIFLPPSYHPSCNCEFLLNSPSGLAFGHNHFLLNPVSGIMSSLALSSLPFVFIPTYSTLWLLHHCLRREICATYVDLHLMVFKWMFKTSLNIDIKGILCELRDLPTVKKREWFQVVCLCVVVKMSIACMLFTCVAVLIISYCW